MSNPIGWATDTWNPVSGCSQVSEACLNCYARWMNPPYGRQTGVWLRKAYEESQRGATVVCLIPARTDTAYWHDYCMKGEVRFLRGRLRFERERERNLGTGRAS